VIKISNGFRYGMIYLMIKKIVELPHHSIKRAQIGKILNLISNDLNMMEDKIQYVSKGFVIPFYVFGTIALLIVRYGLAGLAGTVALLILTFMGLAMTIVNSRILIKINAYKDERVKLITEVIEGVKFIKTYAWEKAFQKIISKVREMEIKQYYWLSFTKGLERTVGTSAGNIASFVIILTLRLIGEEELSTPIIFAILEVFMYLRVALMETSFSLALFQESVITLNRYASILNIMPEKMIRLHEDDDILICGR
jgi:ATP-binding cassette, subfamily C (CFTR/MRP), member 4